MRLVAVIILAAISVGCGRIYYLRGHSDDNYLAPPDVVMRIGEREMAIRNGLSLMGMYPTEMYSENPKVVSVEVSHNGDKAFLVAISAGSARVYYEPKTGENKGFIVHVFAAK